MIHREVVRNRYIDAYRPDTAGAGSPQGAGRGAGLFKVAVGVADEKVVGKPELDKLCPSPNNPDEHCTTGVSDFGDAGNARRIDYVFGRVPNVLNAQVVFNTKISGQPSVSDHAGVFVQLQLP
jgi:endonuclease/exonuclease/phosphatase family metal-dependent hydrolase